MRITLTALAGLALAGAAQAGLLTVDSTNDRVLLLNQFDGSVLDGNFIDLAAATGGASATPLQAMEVGSEIWVSDQLADRIFRFDRNTRSFLGDIGGGGELNNIRGMEQVGNTVYVAMGSDSAAFDEGIITIDATSAMITGQFNGRDGADTSYFDVLSYNGELLVTNIDSGNDGIERYDTAGNFLGFFTQSDGENGFDFAQQMNVNSAGNILVGGFSPPSGVWEVLSDGTLGGIVAGLDFGPRAAWELGNGEILWTNGNFLRTDGTIILEGSSFRFISDTTIPAPSAAAPLALLGLAARRRR